MDLKLKEGESVVKSWDYAKVKGKNKGTLNLTVTNDRIISTGSFKKGLERKEIFVKDVKSVHGCMGIKGPGFFKVLLAVLLGIYSIWFFGIAAVSSSFGERLFGSEELGQILICPFILFGLLCVVGCILLLKKKKMFVLKLVLYKTLTKQKSSSVSVFIPYILSFLVTVLSVSYNISLFNNTQGVGPVIMADVLFVVLIALWVIIIKKNPISFNKVQGLVKAPTQNKKLKLKIDTSIAKEIMEELGAVMLDGKRSLTENKIG